MIKVNGVDALYPEALPSQSKRTQVWVAEFHRIPIAVQENSCIDTSQRGVFVGLISSCWPAISRVLGSGEIPSAILCLVWAPSWRGIRRNCSGSNRGLPKWQEVGSTWLTVRGWGSWTCSAFVERRLRDKLVTVTAWWAATKMEDQSPSWQCQVL